MLNFKEKVRNAIKKKFERVIKKVKCLRWQEDCLKMLCQSLIENVPIKIKTF